MKRMVLALLGALIALPTAGFTESSPHHHEHGTVLPPSDVSPTSIYMAPSTWTASDGTRMRLDRFRGTPVVLALFYASCESACPIIVDAMKRVETSLGARAQQLEFVLVSMDPENDTPANLAAYATKRSLSPDRWTLLTGAEEDVRELAVLIGAKFQRLGSANFAHSNLVILLDRGGRVADRTSSLKELDEFIQSVAAALSTSEHERR